MPGVRFVCDSTCDLADDYRREHGLIVVPLKVIFGEESLIDGVDIDAQGFYDRMRRDSHHPTTSQPTPAEFVAAFRTAAAAGDSVVCTCMSSAMSGTWQSAVAAQKEVAGDLDVHVIDTRTVSLGHHLILRTVIPRAEEGASAAEVVAEIEALILRQRSVFTVASLEFIRRGGRIGGARALLGSVLDIKPVLQVLDGSIAQYKKVRTNARALEALADELISAVGETGRRAHAVVGHADRLGDAQHLAGVVAAHCVEAPEVVPIGPIVGAHAGPGTLGLSFHLA